MSNDHQDREDIPRVSVDGLHDWERIRASFSEAAAAILSQRIASRSSEEQAVVNAHLQKFIDKTFDMTKPNLRINGTNFEDLNEDEQGIEPFDEGLDRHIWSLADQSLQWDGTVANKRRTQPSDVHRLVRELIETERAVDEEEREEYAKEIEGVNITAEDDLDEGVYNEVEDISRQTFAIAGELQQSISLQHERAERLKVVSTEVKSLKP